MKNTIIIISTIILVIGIFFAGIKWNQFQYKDTCLDMGGAINSMEPFICEFDLKNSSNIYK